MCHCGTITISGGTVEANGGENAAAIGTGNSNSNCGDITITSGVNKVTAKKGSHATNSIGFGSDKSTHNNTCGKVTIGGSEGYITTSNYTYQPSH